MFGLKIAIVTFICSYLLILIKGETNAVSNVLKELSLN